MYVFRYVPVTSPSDWFAHVGNLLDWSTVDSVTSDRSYSIERIRRDLGYEPRHDLASGLEETYEWYRENGYIQ